MKYKKTYSIRLFIPCCILIISLVCLLLWIFYGNINIKPDEQHINKNVVKSVIISDSFNKQYTNPDYIGDLYNIKKQESEVLCKQVKLKPLLNNYKQVKIIHLLSKDECKVAIYEIETYASEYGWTKNRHENYPTTDFQLDNIPSHSLVMHKVYNIILPTLANMFNVDAKRLFINDLFVVRYDANNQKELVSHEDGSEFSFVIGLNEEFKGGGTFINNNLHVLNAGECLLFCGQNTHSGVEVTQGVRYIIAGFVNHIHCDDDH